jgi:aminoglycoside phosphotransferase family enzyme
MVGCVLLAGIVIADPVKLEPESFAPPRFEANALLQGLSKPGAYEHGVTAIEVVETHTRRVMVTRDYAYQIKKMVPLAFLDFTSLETRHHYCDEERGLGRKFLASQSPP